MTNLATDLTETARRHPERIALRLEEVEVPYAALGAASARLAGLLVARGLQPGDRVGVMLPNVPSFAIAYYGVLRAGGVVVPVDVRLAERATTLRLADVRARAVIAWHESARAAKAGADCIVVTPGAFEHLLGTAEPLGDPVARADDDTAVILPTPGATGTPEGAGLTHANLRRNAEIVVRMLGLTPEDVILGALPLSHALDLNVAVAAGACLALVPRLDPARAPETAMTVAPTVHM